MFLSQDSISSVNPRWIIASALFHTEYIIHFPRILRGVDAMPFCLTAIIFGITSHNDNFICTPLVWDLRRVLISGNEWKQNIFNLVELITIIYTRPKTVRLLFVVKYILRCQTDTISRDIILTIFSENIYGMVKNSQKNTTGIINTPNEDQSPIETS